MYRDFEQIGIEFNQAASRYFFWLYGEFENSIRPINRQKDENVFKQLQGKFTKRLKEHLQDLAAQLLSRHQAQKNISQLNKSLQGTIDFYIKEFIQKSQSL